MTDDRVIVVREQFAGNVVTVCKSWDAYDRFIEQGAMDWDEEDLLTTDAKVNSFK